MEYLMLDALQCVSTWICFVLIFRCIRHFFIVEMHCCASYAKYKKQQTEIDYGTIKRPVFNPSEEADKATSFVLSSF